MILALLAAPALAEEVVPVDHGAVRLVVERAPVHPMLDRFLRDVGGALRVPTRTETASGVLLSGPGGATVLVTCHHPLAGASSVTVQHGEEELELDAGAFWVAQDLDLAGAVLPGSAWTPGVLASAWPEVGAPLDAWGAAEGGPLVVRSGTAAGVVEVDLPASPVQDLGLVDLTVVPGMSGGPLRDAFGRVVGLVVAGSALDSPWHGRGMALPAPALARALTPPPPSPDPPFEVDDDGRVLSVPRAARTLGLSVGDVIVAVADHTGPPEELAAALRRRPGPVVVQRADGTSVVLP